MSIKRREMLINQPVTVEPVYIYRHQIDHTTDIISSEIYIYISEPLQCVQPQVTLKHVSNASADYNKCH